MKHFFYCTVAVLFSFLASCAGYSKLPIMRDPNTKVDENQFGIWKAVGDTVKDNFFLVQGAYDRYYTVEKMRRKYGSVEKWLIEFEEEMFEQHGPTVVDTQGQIIRMMHLQADDIFNNEVYYYISYLNKWNKTPIYKEHEVSSYRLANADFISVSFKHTPDTVSKKEQTGYLIFKLIKTAPDTIMLTRVTAPVTWVATSERLKEYLEENVNNKAFFGDTVKLYKVKGGHFMAHEALEYMNR